ncbi:MAG: glycosyltransferase [Candidatus Omnitrophota bacterium]|jgi:processive 1,2-diacylglycerol beta-glucosyltransferase
MNKHPRIALLYISEVSGHHSATLAIEKAIRSLEPHAAILNINALNYTNPISEKVVNRLYMEIIKRTPKVWDYLYDNPSIAKSVERLRERIHRFNSPKLKNLFAKFRPDAIACTQAFPCGMVSDFKKTYRSAVPLVGVLTDYIPHSYWIHDNVDYYITPSEEVSLRLASKGTDPARIKSLGIPCDPKFNEPVDRLKTMQALGLEPGLKTILLMGGGQGLGPIKTMVKSLEKLDSPIQEIIVTGTNKKLYRCLKKKLGEYKKNITLLGYAGDIHELMEIADIIMTKPGGVTTAEALGKGIPMVIVKPIPGQEANNTAYLISHGAAIKTDEPDKLNLIIGELLASSSKLSAMRESARRIAKPRASLDIARLLLELATGNG